MVKVKCFNIKYDTDGRKVNLPAEVVVEVDSEWFNDDPDDCVGDAISDATGYCVFGFEYEVI